METKEKVFGLEALLIPKQFEMVDYPSKPLGAWNPAAYAKNGGLVILPRLHFDTHFYASSVGLCEPIPFSNLGNYNRGASPIKTRMLLYPSTDLDRSGIEDPRITEGGTRLLVVGFRKETHNNQTILYDFNGKRATNPRPLLYDGTNLNTGKDAVFLNTHILFFRPGTGEARTYRGEYIINDKNIVATYIDNKNVLPLRKGVTKTGFSTNAVRVSSSRSLIAYHEVHEKLLEYKEGFILLNNEGEILGKTRTFLKTEGILRYASGRPFTLFGCGLVLHSKKLYFVGGVGDVWIAIYSADINKILELM